jgi:hypothetical protein
MTAIIPTGALAGLEELEALVWRLPAPLHA